MPPKKDKDVEDREREWRDGDDSSSISFRDVEKSMTSFSGDDDYPISTWFEEFEDTAELMSWSEIQKLIYAKRLLSGTAKLFLRSLGRVKDYRNLKNELHEEFGLKLNSAAIHKKLSSRKINKDETLQQYFLHMKECALHGKIEDAALMEYVIDGITDSEYNKFILYGASNLKEFRKKLYIYQHIKEKVQQKPDTSTQPSKNTNGKRCFKCGDLDHQAPVCTKGIKCFKCSEFGHKSIDCSSKADKTLNIQNNTITNIDKEDEEGKSPYKKIKINDIEIIALIDTGSDVNLINLTEAGKVGTENSKYNEKIKIQVTGIAGQELSTEGILNAKVMIDNYYADIKFHVVKDSDIPVNVVLGNPILNDFEVNFTADGIFFKKITYLTLLVKEDDTVCCENGLENIKTENILTEDEIKSDVDEDYELETFVNEIDVRPNRKKEKDEKLTTHEPCSPLSNKNDPNTVKTEDLLTIDEVESDVNNEHCEPKTFVNEITVVPKRKKEKSTKKPRKRLKVQNVKLPAKRN